jgi:hypothetical protein
MPLLVYTLVTVPEPATWATLIGGLAGVGVVLRRSSRRARRRFYLNCGLNDAEATEALTFRRGDLKAHVDEMKRRRGIDDRTPEERIS